MSFPKNMDNKKKVKIYNDPSSPPPKSSSERYSNSSFNAGKPTDSSTPTSQLRPNTQINKENYMALYWDQNKKEKKINVQK